MFENIDQLREITELWIVDYNEKRPHDALMGVPPITFGKMILMKNNPEKGNIIEKFLL